MTKFNTEDSNKNYQYLTPYRLIVAVIWMCIQARKQPNKESKSVETSPKYYKLRNKTKKMSKAKTKTKSKVPSAPFWQFSMTI